MAIVFLVFIIGAMIAFAPNTTTFSPSEPDEPRVTEIGMGAPIVIRQWPDRSEREIRWVPLSLNLLIAVAIALAADCGIRETIRGRVVVYFIASLVGVIVFSFLCGIVWSRYYWGYWLRPPPALPEVATLKSVQHVINFRTSTQGQSPPQLVVSDSQSLQDYFSSKWTNEYEFAGPLLFALRRQGLLPEKTTDAFPELDLLAPALTASGQLVKSDAEYQSETRANGYLVVGQNHAGETLWLVSFNGAEVSNDHYPWYNFAFKRTDRGLEFINGRHHYYDAAGIEGFEWPVVAILLTIPLTVIVWIVQAIVLGIRSSKRDQQRESLTQSQS